MKRTENWVLPNTEGDGDESDCDSLINCFFLMIRLAFIDSLGSDFIESLYDKNHNFLVVLLVLYMFQHF